jgi:hypothetical protein
MITLFKEQNQAKRYTHTNNILTIGELRLYANNNVRKKMNVLTDKRRIDV